ncbi:MAG: rhomboid family intramembrane serine protease [Chitinophagaceae bacterium]|nr:rhomboid family intramembrane serine protease [Chitinophagaceae bacterium]
MIRLTPTIKKLLTINVACYGIGLLLQLLYNFGFLINPKDISSFFALHHFNSLEFHYHQLLTYMFFHGGVLHILSNMLGLVMFGVFLERVWEGKRFLFFYLATGVGAGIIYIFYTYILTYQMNEDAKSYMINPTPDRFELFVGNYLDTKKYTLRDGKQDDLFAEFHKDPTNKDLIYSTQSIVIDIVKKNESMQVIGASGAVFAILVAFALLFPNFEIQLLIPPILVKAKYLVLFYIVYEIFCEYSTMVNDNVAHSVHLGGAFIGFCIIKYWQKYSKNFY